MNELMFPNFWLNCTNNTIKWKLPYIIYTYIIKTKRPNFSKSFTISVIVRTRTQSSPCWWSFRSWSRSSVPEAARTSFKIFSCHSYFSACDSEQESLSLDGHFPGEQNQSDEAQQGLTICTTKKEKSHCINKFCYHITCRNVSQHII